MSQIKDTLNISEMQDILNMSQIQDWSNEDVINWIQKEYADKPQRQQLLTHSIKENEYNGEELLLCENVDELMEALDIKKKVVAKGLFEKITKVKDKAINEMIYNAANKSANGDDAENKLKTAEDLDYLLQIFEGLFPYKRENEIKEEEIDENNPIQQFLSMVKGIAHTTKDFVKSLLTINVRKSLTNEIISICFRYYELLKLTLQRFCKYGGDIKQLNQCMTEISNIFLLPSIIKKDLDKLDIKSQQKAIMKLRESTCNGLKSSTTQFKLLLDDVEKIHVKNLQHLSDDWFKLNKRIMKLLTVLQEDKKLKEEKVNEKKNYDATQITEQYEINVNATLDKMKYAAKYAAGFCLKWIVAPLTFGVGVCLSVTTGAICVVGGVALCTTGLGAIGGVPLIAVGVAGASALCYKSDKCMQGIVNYGNNLKKQAKNELAEMKEIEKTQENIKQIEMMQSSLARMAKVSQTMSNVLNLEINNFNKIKQYNPHDEIKCGGYTNVEVLFMNKPTLNKIQKLGEAILNCTKYLEKSRKNIEMVEKTCEQEMNDFFEYVQKPLIKMVNNNGSNKQ